LEEADLRETNLRGADLGGAVLGVFFWANGKRLVEPPQDPSVKAHLIIWDKYITDGEDFWTLDGSSLTEDQRLKAQTILKVYTQGIA
jgi:hypothetical protein